MTEEIKDETTEVIETTPDDDKAKVVKDDKKDDDKGALPDVDEKTDEKTQAVQSILDEYDIDSPKQLGEFLKNLSGLKDQLGDVDLEELKKNSALLKKYQKHWAKEEEAKKEDGETPEETIARLKKQNEQLDRKRRDEAEMYENAEADKRALNNFNSTVTKAVDALSVPSAMRPFLLKALGVNNEINEVDMSDKVGIKRITKAAFKDMKELQQAFIKDYLKGKTEIPKISTSAGTPSDKPVTITKKNARAIAIERLKGLIKK